MSEATESVTGEVTEQIDAETDASTEAEGTEQAKPDPDAGAKSALVAERKARKAAEKAFADYRTEQESKDKPAEQQAIDNARREAVAEATTAANKRILRSDIKAAAKGKLADPTDAHLYINLDDFDVNDDGDFDSDALDEAIDALIARKPHLAAAAARKFAGEADQGAKRGGGQSQLTQAELEKMSPAEIVTAQRSGRLNSLLGIPN